MSDSPVLVDFAIGLVMSVLNLPDGQVLFFWGNSNYRRIVINPANQKGFWETEMTCGLVHASYSLPEWQAVKLTFFALSARRVHSLFLFVKTPVSREGSLLS